MPPSECSSNKQTKITVATHKRRLALSNLAWIWQTEKNYKVAVFQNIEKIKEKIMLDFSQELIVNLLTKYCKTFKVHEHCVDTRR